MKKFLPYYVIILVVVIITFFWPFRGYCKYCSSYVQFYPAIFAVYKDNIYHKDCHINFTRLWSYLYMAKINVKYYQLLNNKYGSLFSDQANIATKWENFEIKCSDLWSAKPLSESTVDELYMEKFNIEKLEIEPPDLNLLKAAQEEIDKELGVTR